MSSFSLCESIYFIASFRLQAVPPLYRYSFSSSNDWTGTIIKQYFILNIKVDFFEKLFAK